MIIKSRFLKFSKFGILKHESIIIFDFFNNIIKFIINFKIVLIMKIIIILFIYKKTLQNKHY